MKQKFNINDRVVVNSECNSKGKTGTVVKYCSYPEWYSASIVGVRLDTGEYLNYNSKSLKMINENDMEVVKMEGNFRIAVVNLLEDYYKKDFGFALFEDANVGDLVVCNPRGSYSLGKVKNITTQEEYGKSVTKEIISVVDMDAYNKRVEERKIQLKLKKEKEEIKKELDKKISKLKDAEYYERIAKEFGDKDPEIVVMALRLKELSV
ncbi:hypothetical protein KQI61_15290 [Anaerocolumna aminovalerica]|uniref:hypothetical protein n=1 Tax=Anaerocolumna aminovalerica TaxID=1527 RepID=UPI001C0F018D|nr:hypothetical protein [Anaerocolumna aminovalerica]MBU5333563.1 hypothetical protein [Anaerocolumna aminovalerica]